MMLNATSQIVRPSTGINLVSSMLSFIAPYVYTSSLVFPTTPSSHSCTRPILKPVHRHVPPRSHSLTSILLTRFYFDLQETAYPPTRSTGAALPGWSRTTGDLGFSAETHTLAFAAESASDSDGQTGSSTSSSPTGGSDLQGSPEGHSIELEMRISGYDSEVGERRGAIL